MSSVLEKRDATSQKSKELNCTTVKVQNPTLMQSLYSVFSKQELYVGYPESNAPFFSWPVTKPCMWDFWWHKLEVPRIFVQSCTDFCWSLGTKSDSFWNKKSRAPWYASLRSLLHSCKPWDAAVCCYHLARINASQPNNWLSPSICIRSWSHQPWFQIFKD